MTGVYRHATTLFAAAEHAPQRGERNHFLGRIHETFEEIIKVRVIKLVGHSNMNPLSQLGGGVATVANAFPMS
jgi:hypothetical protein